MSLKKFSMGKIFKLDIFILEYVFDHSKSISSKKNSIFFGHFLAKNDILNFWCQSFKTFFRALEKDSIVVILRYCTHPSGYSALQAH